MKIALITGGLSEERSVSIASANNVQKILSEYHDIDVYLYPDDFLNIKQKDYDCIILLIHGLGGEDGSLQEKISIPYVFSKPTSLRNTFDKNLCKNILKNINIISPETYSFNDEIIYPIIAKPISGGSSIDTYYISSDEDLKLLNRKDLLLEQYISGREFSVGVIDYDDSTLSLPVVEINKKGFLFSQDEKYSHETHKTEICPANISENLKKDLQKQALRIHEHMNLKHISRSDFIVTKDNQIFFLEVNTIPGMTNQSLIIKELLECNISLKDCFDYWCNSVLK